MYHIGITLPGSIYIEHTGQGHTGQGHTGQEHTGQEHSF